jgi:hypothetical protein
MTAPGDLDITQLRAERSRLQQLEDAVSFVRRVAQGRLDLARDERRRRSENLPSVDVTTDLAALFGQEHGGGSTRPPRDTVVSLDHPLALDLDSLCDEVGFGTLGSLDVDSLDAAIDRLDQFERRCSDQRRALFEQIDALTADLVRRYKLGGASVDSLLDES